jgi:hypothetical protein
MEGTMPQDNITFKEVADRYLTLSNRFREQSLHESAQKTLESGILSKWQPMPIADITRAHGIQLLESVVAQSPNQSVTVACVITNIFALALREGHIKANPMRGFVKIVLDEPTPPPTAPSGQPTFGL